MSQKNETPILILSLLITAGILGGGYWWFTHQSENNQIHQINQTSDTPTPVETSPNNQELPSPPSPVAFAPPASVPRGTTVRIDGSTSMAQINQALKNIFQQQFPGTNVIINAQGSEKGLNLLLNGQIDLAAISRPLTPQEKEQGLIPIPVTQDAIAIVVGEKNPFRKGLTQTQIMDIFQGRITDWTGVGGSGGTIRVINRPPISGTYNTFRELVLRGGNFGTTPNITSMERDATTPILQALGKDGISYATYSQVANQQTVRTVAVDGLTPEAANYPYQRTLYYVYKDPPNASVEAFLGFVTSPLGKEAIGHSQSGK